MQKYACRKVLHNPTISTTYSSWFIMFTAPQSSRVIEQNRTVKSPLYTARWRGHLSPRIVTDSQSSRVKESQDCRVTETLGSRWWETWSWVVSFCVRMLCRSWLKTRSWRTRTVEVSRSDEPPPCWRLCPNRWRARCSWEGCPASENILWESSRWVRTFIKLSHRTINEDQKITTLPFLFCARRTFWRMELQVKLNLPNSLSAIKLWRSVCWV